MTARSIKTLINLAQAELGIDQSTVIYGAGADPSGIQMGALANRMLDELRRMHNWSAMQREFDIIVPVATITTGNMAAQSAVITNLGTTTGLQANFYAVGGAGIPQAARIISVDSVSQVTMSMTNTNTTALTHTQISFAKDTFQLANDFDFFENATMWDRSNFWKLIGPDSAQQDEYLRSGITPLTPRRHWRLLGPYTNQFRIWPPPRETATPLQLVLEYDSSGAVNVTGSGASFAQYFVNDSDTCLLDENAIVMGIKWLYWEIKGFGSYVTMQNRWVDYVQRLMARDGGAPTLAMTKRESGLLISPANVQDGNFPAGVDTSSGA